MKIIKCPYCEWKSNPNYKQEGYSHNYPSKQLYYHFKKEHPEKLKD